MRKRSQALRDGTGCRQSKQIPIKRFAARASARQPAQGAPKGSATAPLPAPCTAQSLGPPDQTVRQGDRAAGGGRLGRDSAPRGFSPTPRSAERPAPLASANRDTQSKRTSRRPFFMKKNTFFKKKNMKKLPFLGQQKQTHSWTALPLASSDHVPVPACARALRDSAVRMCCPRPRGLGVSWRVRQGR